MPGHLKWGTCHVTKHSTPFWTTELPIFQTWAILPWPPLTGSGSILWSQVKKLSSFPFFQIPEGYQLHLLSSIYLSFSNIKSVYFCFIDYAKAFDCVGHNKLWKILKEMGLPDHLTCLLRNLYAGQESIVRTRHGTMGWFKIWKGVHQGYVLSPCLFNF